VHASLSRDTVEVGESVDLMIVVAGTVRGVAQPEVPVVDYLRVVSSGSSQNITFANGRLDSTYTYTFRLQASREGTYAIPAIDIHAAGQVLTTQPLTLTVVATTSPVRPPTAPPRPPTGRPSPEPEEPPPAEEPPSEDVFASLEVDNESPYVGQQVTMTLSFYQSHRTSLLGSAEYAPPSTEGLVAEPLPDPPSRTVPLGGIPYEVIARSTALIAPAPGEYTIGPATIDFRRGYVMGEETVTTDPVTLRVRPLPAAGRPPDFSGVVGRLHATLSATTDSVRVGDAVTVRLEVAGSGDIRQLEAPELSLSGPARVYPSGEQREVGPQTTGDGYVIGGTVAFEYLVMPAQVGEVTIEPVVIHYFNAAARRYESAQTAPVTLRVLPGEGGETSLRSEGEEIRYIREDGLGLRSHLPVTSRTWFWLIQLAPLAGVGWALRRRAELRRRVADPRYRRYVEAAATAQARLSRIARAGEPRSVHHAVDAALTDYIAAKTGAVAASLSPDEARSRLQEAGCPADLADRATEMLFRLRAGVYAPGSSTAPRPDEAIAMARALLADIEARLR